MRRVQVADHQAHHPPQLIGHRRRRGALAVRLARLLPVHAVEIRIEEIVAEERPALLKHLQLLAGEVGRELRGDVQRPRLPRVDRDDVDPARVEVEHLAVVGRDLRAGLAAGRRRQLPRHRAIRRELIERVRVEIGLSRRAGNDDGVLAVGRDRDVVHVEADGKEREALTDIFKDGRQGFLGVPWGSWGFRWGSRGVPGRFRSSRGLREEIPKQILPELRCPRREVDARELALLGALAGREEKIRPVAAPRDRVREDVREEADRTRRAVAARRDQRDVREALRADREHRDPLAVRRPDRPRRVERIGERAGRDHAILLRREVQHPQLLAVAEERDRLPVGREHRPEVRRGDRRERRLGRRSEIVQTKLLRAFACRDVGDPPAVGRPDGVRLDGGRGGHARRVAAVLRRRREHVSARDEHDLPAVGREREVGKLIRLPRALGRGRRGDAAPRDRHLLRLPAGGVHRPDAEVPLEGDRPAVGRDRWPQHAPVVEARHRAIRAGGRRRPRPDVLDAVAIGDVEERRPVRVPHRRQLARVALRDLGVRLRAVAGDLVDVDDPQLRLVDVAAGLAPPLIRSDAARAERQPVAVGRRRRAKFVDVPIGRDGRRRAALAGHAEDVVHARDVVARRAEVDPPRIARPAVQLLQPVVPRHSAERAGRERDDVDVAAAGPRGDERELASVGREERAPVVGRIGREQARVAAAGRDGPDVAAGRERNLTPVRRDARLAERVLGRRRRRRSLCGIESAGRSSGHERDGGHEGERQSHVATIGAVRLAFNSRVD